MPKPVTIVIPAYKHLEWQERCLKSLLASKPGGTFQVWISDDGPPSERLQAPDMIHHVDGHHEKKGFVANLNHFVEKHWNPDTHLLLVNQDTHTNHTQEGWLEHMVWCLERRWDTDRGAAIGPMSNYVLGCQSIVEDKQGKFMVATLTKKMPPEGFTYWVPMLSGFFVLYHQKVVLRRLRELGSLFDSRFNMIGCDDLDFSFWCRANGYTLWCHKGLFVFHEDTPEEKRPIENDTPRAVKLLDKKWPGERKRRWTTLHFREHGHVQRAGETDHAR